MTEPARFEPVLLRREQDSQENQLEQPWMRMKSEPAAWYMRFKRYLAAGNKRSLRALVAAESGTQVYTKEGKKLSDVSVPRPWRRASQTWHWTARAAAYDLDQMEIQAAGIRQVASTSAHASKAYRILKLDYLARVLEESIKKWKQLQIDDTKDFLATIARYQSVLRDLAGEMEGLGTIADSVDAAAFNTLVKEAEQQEFEEKLKNASMHERNKLILDRYDRES